MPPPSVNEGPTIEPPRQLAPWHARTALAVLVVALIALFALPQVVAHLQDEPRAQMSGVFAAQAAVNDLQEGLANAQLSQSFESVSAQLQDDAVKIRTATRNLDRESQMRAAAVDSSLAAVRQSLATGTVVGTIPAVNAESRRLERHLDDVGRATQNRLMATARWNRIVPVFLVPLTLLAVALVWQIGRRAALAAAAAEVGRLAYERAVLEKESLIRGVTHDIKNPLSATLGYVDLMRDGLIDRTAMQELDPLGRIERLVHAALGSVNDLVDVARGKAPASPPEHEPVDLAQLVRAVTDDFAPSAATAGLALHLEPTNGTSVIASDEGRVRRIVENLLSNAVKYTPRDGQISVRLSTSGPCAVIAVADTGPGIPEPLRERIFDEFYRIEGSAAPGAGIGLAFSRRVARDLGGDLGVRAAPDGGSLFELTLPTT